MRIMSLACVLLASALVANADAAPKKSSTGAACSSTGTERKDGKDQSGNTLNCQWDTCTYCAGPHSSATQIDCSVLKTEYSNPTDCHAAAKSGGTRFTPVNPSLLNSRQRSTTQGGAVAQ